MKLKCIADNLEGFTLNKEYSNFKPLNNVDITQQYFILLDDSDRVIITPTSNFKLIKEPDDSLTIDEKIAKECNSFEEYLNKVTEYYKSLDVHIWGSEDSLEKREKDISFGRIMAYEGVLEQYNRFKNKDSESEE